MAVRYCNRCGGIMKKIDDGRVTGSIVWKCRECGSIIVEAIFPRYINKD